MSNKSQGYWLGLHSFHCFSCGIESKFPSFLCWCPLPLSFTLVIVATTIIDSPFTMLTILFSSSHSPPPYDCLATRIESKDGIHDNIAQSHTKFAPTRKLLGGWALQSSSVEDPHNTLVFVKGLTNLAPLLGKKATLLVSMMLFSLSLPLKNR